jgi:hypothetical protein
MHGVKQNFRDTSAFGHCATFHQHKQLWYLASLYHEYSGFTATVAEEGRIAN